MNLELAVTRAFSDFLCPVCHEPWYVEIQSKYEVCVNPACPIRDRTLRLYDPKSQDTLRSEMAVEADRLRAKLVRWDRVRLVSSVYEARRQVIRELWSTGRVKFRECLLLDELLSFIASVESLGNDDPGDIKPLITDFGEYFSKLTMIEDLTYGRFLMAADKTILVLKYWDVIREEVLRSYGIIPPELDDASGIFRYADVDQEAKESLPTKGLLDFRAYFDRMFDLLATMKYCFEMYKLTASRHDYDPTGTEMAALLGLAYSSRNPVEIWSVGKLAKNLRQYRPLGVASFITKYCDGPKLAPLVPRVAGNVIFDWHTLLFYMHYLAVKNMVKSAGQDVTGSDSFTLARDQASRIFEGRARTLLENKGYNVVPKPMRVKFGGESWEYDIIASHEGKVRVVIAETKYRDPSPSSLNRDGLLYQEILGQDGALAWAVAEQNRLEMMTKNVGRFSELLSLKRDFTSYRRDAYIITKFRPVIQRYRQVNLVSLPEFYTMQGL